MTRTLFVTGTDTGVGKTRTSCALLRAFRQRGLRAVGMKPVAAGAVDTPDGPRSDDALALLSAGVPAPYETVNPYLLAPPIAPHIAAAQAGVSIDFDVIRSRYRTLARDHDLVVVEGAGGFLVPLGPGRDFADLAVALAAPVVLVVGLRLGCLNHALLTAEAIRQRGLELEAWVGSRIDPAFEPLAANLEALRTRLPGRCWGVIDNRPENDSIDDFLDLNALELDQWLRASATRPCPPGAD